MDIDEAVLEVQQSRSAYQIARFVLGQHDTPEMRFYQLCLELGSIRHKLRLTENNIKQMKIKTQRLLDKGDELSLLKAEEAEINLEQVLKAQKGAEREHAIMEDMFNNCVHFTRDEIEHAQPEYWEKRLTRQTNLQIMAGNLGWAQLDAMKQADLLDGLIEERHAQLEADAVMQLSEGENSLT